MMNKTTHSFKGMRKDVDSLKFSPEYLEDARNIRLTPTIKDTLLSITCERYPDPIGYIPIKDLLSSLKDVYVMETNTEVKVSECNINDILVLFLQIKTSVFLENNIEDAKTLDSMKNAYKLAISIRDTFQELKNNDNTDYSTVSEKVTELNNLCKSWNSSNNNLSLIKERFENITYYSIAIISERDYQGTYFNSMKAIINSLPPEFEEAFENLEKSPINCNAIIALNTDKNSYIILFSGYKNLDTGEEVNYLNLGENIDFLPYYENNEIQKIYWVDGINQPRVINIATKEEDRKKWDNHSFDFTPTIDSSDTISVDKVFRYGNFAPGVIQYCFTYFDKDGKESNIANISPLLYIKDEGKGNSPEDIVTNNNFNIKLENTNPKFENARIYSIHRTSLNSMPTCKVVGEISLKPSEKPTLQSIKIVNNTASAEGETPKYQDVNLQFKNYSGKRQNIRIEYEIKSFDTEDALNDFRINGKKAVVYKDSDETIVIQFISGGSVLTTGASEASEVTLFAYASDLSKPENNLPVTIKPFQPGIDDTVVEGGGGGGGGSTSTPSVKLTSWSFPSAIKLKVGDSRNLRINIEPAGATGVSYSFSVADNGTYNDGILDLNTTKISYVQKNSILEVKALRPSGDTKVTITATVNQPSYNIINAIKKCTVEVVDEKSTDFNLNTNTGIRSIEFQEALKEVGIEIILPSEDTEMYFNNKGFTNIFLNKGEYEIHNTLLDTGLMGYNIDPSELLYKGGDKLYPSTITQKDGTLFLGNVTLAETQTTSFLEAKQLFQDYIKDNPGVWTSRDLTSPASTEASELFTVLSENASNSKAFKRNETYRFGIQLQDNQGKWTPAIPLLDTKCTGKVEFNIAKNLLNNNIAHLYRPKYIIEVPEDIQSKLQLLGYYKIRPVVVLPTELNREIIAQGIVNSTVYNTNQRCNTEFAAQSSWFFRPIQGNYGRFGVCTDQRAIKVTTAKDSINEENIYKDEDIEQTNALVKSYNSAYWPFNFGDKQQASAGFPIAYRHHELIPPSYCRNAEFPHMWYHTGLYPSESGIEHYTVNNSDGTSEIYNVVDSRYAYGARNYYTENISTKHTFWDRDYYAVDCSILTFHSPEIEFNKISNVSGCKFRLVGYSLYSHAVKGVDVQQEGAYFNINEDTVNTRNIKDKAYKFKPSYSTHTTVKFPVTLKTKTSSEETYPNEDKWPVTFATYTWNYPNMYDDEKYKLKVNKSSHLHIFDTTKYFDEPHLLEITDTKIFDGSSDNIVLKFPQQVKWGNVNWANTPKNTFVYKGNVNDIIASFSTSAIDEFYFTPFKNNDGTWYPSKLLANPEYPIMGTISTFNSANYDYKNGFYIIRKTKGVSDKPGWSTEKTPGSDTGAELYRTNQPIQLTYKSSPHGVIVLDCGVRTGGSDPRWLILPILDESQEYKISSYASHRYTVDGMLAYIGQDTISNNGMKVSLPKDHRGYLYIGELYREMTPEEKYGSLDNENNIWTVAGKSSSISEGAIHYTEGDTFFSQYDCLKTYPRNNTDFNQVTEIGTFWIETRVNTATRYDNNRNQISNMHVSPNNFNKFNPVYDQTDNFFTYRTIKDELIKNTKFPHTIVWSKQKIKGDKIDTWTNINMTATLDLDGIDGDLVKLYNFNNEIFSFQPKGVNHILFNSRIQVNSSDGVPIEIQNGYRVDGARKISSIGASHIKCINDNNSSIFFTDSLTKGIYAFNGSVVESLSDKLNFSVWASKNITNNSYVYVDHTNKNIYIRNINSNTKEVEVLGYSELLGEFESFYDYEYPILKSNNSTFTIKFSKIDNASSISIYKLYSNSSITNHLDFNNSYISFIHNNQSTSNKCYTSIEYKSDSISELTGLSGSADSNIAASIPFKSIFVNSHYMKSQEVPLVFKKYEHSNLKKKFNSWRIEFPRGQEKIITLSRKYKRFQCPWVNIKLTLDRSKDNELGHSIPYLDVYFLE